MTSQGDSPRVRLLFVKLLPKDLQVIGDLSIFAP